MLHLQSGRQRVGEGAEVFREDCEFLGRKEKGGEGRGGERREGMKREGKEREGSPCS